MACRSAKGTGPTRAGGANSPVFRASTPHTEWSDAHSIRKWKGAMSLKGRVFTKLAGSTPVSAKCLAARSRKPPIDLTVCRKVGTLRSFNLAGGPYTSRPQDFRFVPKTRHLRVNEYTS